MGQRSRGASCFRWLTRVNFFAARVPLLTHTMSDPTAAAAADPARLAARAQAHLKLGHWLEAADDARKACDWAPGMTEAWALRG